QGGPAPELSGEVVEKFRAEMEKYQFADFVVHCPYYINFGSSRPQTYHGSIAIVRGELERTSLLGGQYVMFHTGSGKDLGKAKAIAQARQGLQHVLDGYNGSARLLIEIAAGAGEVLGDTFEEVAELMEPVKRHPGFGGVCFDTQHAWASGYNLQQPAAVFAEFGRAIGLNFLKMSHMNDSKTDLGSRKDRHEHIGGGLIGRNGFGMLLKYWSQNLKLKAGSHKTPGAFPLILETEHDKVRTDIQVLKNLRDKI
ncbi:MAG TPA: deoxyribonuclease IV, partial [Patescibacteria group bacterium]|nr:deoxyribonuclease IV [Patescibacteria group bacterium]